MRDRARWRNWGGNQQCSPAAVETPTSELEVVEAVRRAKRAGQPVKVVGAGHSFTGIACTDGRMAVCTSCARQSGTCVSERCEQVR